MLSDRPKATFQRMMNEQILGGDWESFTDAYIDDLEPRYAEYHLKSMLDSYVSMVQRLRKFCLHARGDQMQNCHVNCDLCRTQGWKRTN